MDKKIAGLLGAAAALTAINTTTQATPAQNTELAPGTTYRDLLNPVPNALSALKADNARLSRDQANGPTRLAQVSVQVGHHHHHHHHGVRIRVGQHHHHHHVVRIGHHHHHHHVRVRVHDHDWCKKEARC
jgi:hypothetical protein